MKYRLATALSACAATFFGVSLSRAVEPYSFNWGRQVGTAEEDQSLSVAATTNSIYIGGMTRGSLSVVTPNPAVGTTDGFVLRYSPTGTLDDSGAIGGVNSDAVLGLSFNGFGRLNVVGSTNNNLADTNRGGSDAFFAQYASALVRPTLLRQFGTTADDFANAAATVRDDFSGGGLKTYIVGRTFGNLQSSNRGQDDAFIVRYDGSFTTTLQIGRSGPDSANAIIGDGTGGYIMAGSLHDLGATPDTGANVFVRRYDTNNSLLPGPSFSSPGAFADVPTALALDNRTGAYYVAGYTEGSLAGSNPSPGTRDSFVARYDSSANLVWMRQLNLPGADYISGVAPDSGGGVLVTGSTVDALAGETSAGLSDVFVANFNDAGQMIWSDQFGSDKNDVATGISIDGAGGVYITGYTEAGLFGSYQGGASDAFLVRYQAIPEPASLVLITAALGLLRRRQRGPTQISSRSA